MILTNDQRCGQQSSASPHSNLPDPLLSDLVFLEHPGDQAVSLCNGPPMSVFLLLKMWSPKISTAGVLEMQNLRSHSQSAVTRSSGCCWEVLLCSQRCTLLGLVFKPLYIWPDQLSNLISCFCSAILQPNRTLTPLGLCLSCYMNFCAHSSHLCKLKPYPCFKTECRCNLF